jgi:hypothetical protein
VAIDTEEQGQNVCFTTSELRQLRKYLLGEKTIAINTIKSNTKFLEKLGHAELLLQGEQIYIYTETGARYTAKQPQRQWLEDNILNADQSKSLVVKIYIDSLGYKVIYRSLEAQESTTLTAHIQGLDKLDLESSSSESSAPPSPPEPTDPPPTGHTPERRSKSGSRERSDNNSRIRSPGSESSTDGEYSSDTDDLAQRLGVTASLNVLTAQTDNQLLNQKLHKAEADLADKNQQIKDSAAQIAQLLIRISECESDLKRAADFYEKPRTIADCAQLSPNGKAVLKDPAAAGSPALKFNASLRVKRPASEISSPTASAP